MDIDQYIARNQPTWNRLAELTSRARRSLAGLGPDGVDELITLYQRASAQLSHARSEYRDPALTARLTALVASAGGVIYSKRARTLRGIATFITETFPAAVWASRRFIAVSALLLLAPAVAVGTWVGSSDAALDASAPDAVRTAYVEEDFEAYYSSVPAAQFATQVTVNNIQVAILAFALGALLCVGAGVVLVVNGANVGVAGGVFAAAGELSRFFGLILPHGLLELTAVAVAGGAGMRVGWAVISPGDRTRSDAFAAAGRSSVVVIIGLVFVFLLAGTVEGFVTGSNLPTLVRVGLGVAIAGAFGTYVVTLGRRAVAADPSLDQSLPVALTLR